MRYSCGPASSYAAKRVDVPKGLHTQHRRLQAFLGNLEMPELQTLHATGRGISDTGIFGSVHSPGIPIQIKDMHKARHPVRKDLTRDDVSIEAAPEANSLSIHVFLNYGERRVIALQSVQQSCAHLL